MTSPASGTCPVCGTSAAREILYGYPAVSAFEDPDVVLGGCIVTGPSPSYACRNPDCGARF